MKTIILIPFCFIIDQCFKKIAENKWKNKKHSILNKINLSLSYNEGAFLGILKNRKDILMILNIAGLFFLIFMYIDIIISNGYGLLRIGFALMLGGSISNVYDRIVRKKVIDYFSFSIKPRLYFNLADMFVFFGCFLIFLSSFISHKSL